MNTAQNKLLKTILTASWFASFLVGNAHAIVTNVAYWRGGENDSPAPNFNVDPGIIGNANNTTVDLMGNYNLTNNNAGAAYYASSAAYAGVGGLASNSSVALITAGSGLYTSTINAGTANFGFQAYVRPNNTTGTQIIASNGGAGNGWNLLTIEGSLLGFASGYRYFVEVAGKGILDSGITVDAGGAFANIAYVNDNGSNRFFYNFNQVASANLGGITAATGYFSLGYNPSIDPPRYYTGGIDEARLFTFEEGQFQVSDLENYLPVPTYASWAAANAGGQTANLDWDNDGVPNGVEFFMNAAPGFTANPGLDGSKKVTWTNGGNIPSTGYGTQFVVQISTDLVTWDDVTEGDFQQFGTNTASSLSYTLDPANNPGKQFVRLKVTPN